MVRRTQETWQDFLNRYMVEEEIENTLMAAMTGVTEHTVERWRRGEVEPKNAERWMKKFQEPERRRLIKQIRTQVRYVLL
jgi:hypothetical protein